MARELITYPNTLLRMKSEPVRSDSAELGLIHDMIQVMQENGCIGLAANQLGVLSRVIVYQLPGESVHVLVNPCIVGETGLSDTPEGCLSLPGILVPVIRNARVVVNGYDQDMSFVTVEADGLLAACLQHEIDHLDGKLIIDYLSPLKRNLAVGRVKKYLAKKRRAAKKWSSV